jgi:DNA-binding response OmpR family regulator
MYKMHHEEIALVLTDMGLPGLTGMDVFKAMKEINPEVKLLFMSGFVEPDVKAMLLEAGARGFIQKPYTRQELLLRLRAVLDE